jgi:secreted trypsin-like serine protease
VAERRLAAAALFLAVVLAGCQGAHQEAGPVRLEPATSAAPTTTTLPPAAVAAVPGGAAGYQVALYKGTVDRRHWYCGGSLVGPRRVLTAGHCLWRRTKGRFQPVSDTQVVVGAAAIDGRGGQRRRPVGWATPEGYKGDPAGPDDVGLITLDRPVGGVAPMPVVAAGAGASATATLTGWGGAAGGRLLAARVTLVAGPPCQAAAGRGLAAGKVLCARTGAVAGPCIGDGGGPLVARAGAAAVQVGVLGGRPGCPDAGRPGVFARLADPAVNGFVRAQLAGRG